MKQLLLINLKPDNIPRAADWIESICRSEGLPEMDSYQVKTCVVEAINNAVEHAYGFGKGTINIGLWKEGRQMMIEISNDNENSQSVDFAQDAEPVPESERGRGWLIIKSWVDDAVMKRRGGRTVVRLTKRIPI
ncbi:MAG: ATP-binding protein [Gammaproteobacteria bacterium]|nr:MAG: ATP-binding protein [Gammaproteobacteria bacterium]